MKFSKQWLQDYIVETLPENEVVVDTLNKKSFEVEEVTSLPNDTVYDIKVLPNRAHDALGHRGMARELCADLGLTFKEDSRVEKRDDFTNSLVPAPVLSVNDAKFCSRFMSMRIDGVVVEESPEWLKTRLEAIGQRSINNIVDATNYVQFALNKPMHAYDTRSIKGTLATRFAKSGEVLTTLDDKELALDEKTLVIADEEKSLGLAGIKGGKHSGINEDTTSIILESANFNPSLIRKTSQRYDLHTDASKRFENGIANSLIEEGLYMTANLIKELCKDVEGSVATDVYLRKDTKYHVGISLSELNMILGTTYTNNDVESTLRRLSFSFEKIIPENYITETYKAVVGVPYKNPSSMREDAPHAFNCSSLISYLYKGIWMPSISVDKYVFSERVKLEELRFGDLVFANSGEGKIYFESVEFLRGTKVPEGVDHVGMYLGGGKIVHSTRVHGKVVVESMEEFSATRKIVGYGRVVENLKEERYVVNVPSERLDIRIKEDLAEEIGRILGYEKLVPVLPKLSRVGLVHKRLFYEDKVREILLNHGFSEVMTYTFGSEGEVSIIKGLAGDKEKLRVSLRKGMEESLKLNVHNAPLLGQKVIKIFEFGNVFTKDSEIKKLAFALGGGTKKDNFGEEAKSIVKEIGETFGVDVSKFVSCEEKPCITEIDFDAVIEKLEEPKEHEVLTYQFLLGSSYKTVSPYPFALRDIAVFVGSGTGEDAVKEIIKSEAGSLLTRIEMFDKFEKDSKISYAFHLVFLSQEKTLSDIELDEIMNRVTNALNSKEGWQVR
ncbi:MAG: phenylalanyl-tRNA synthetase beta chain [Parcubacteria group bacterium LiPW_30]|nr:MAG: phenylalanyl-tRNA synthetase beta chain [Parcubacteria group bacterium LiPW_30]